MERAARDAPPARPTFVPVSAGPSLPIHAWDPSADREQWGYLLQTVGTSLTEAEKEDIMRRGDVDAIAPEAGAYSRLKKLAAEDRKSVFEEVERLGLLEVMQVMPQGALRYQGHVPLTELPLWAEEMQLNHTRISRETAREAHRSRRAPKILSRRVMM